MNVRKPIITSLISLATLAPCKAQKAVQLVSETGITGVVNKEASFYGGMNFQLPRGRNFTDLYAGVNVQPDKKTSFVGLAINNFSWTKNISSWVRETFVASKRGANSQLEIAPIRANADVGKFNFSLSPSYTMYNDFKEGTTTQGINTIFQTTYSMTPRDIIFAEAKYTSEPSKNLFNTHFGKLKDNISYMVSYMRKF
ncbi:hypothetical protein IJ579_05885 [bacterium]|nr:hypothetical protein [bacterium]MBQ8460697.1 hypothetical protein [bacterium]MBQ8460765.1 hypothetical protein [bacterium]MBR1425074.1 hypothetical protein [bacterium]